jgi:hypothetical protein
MSDQAQITVRRKTSYPDRLRAYKVRLDGVVVGSVRARDSVTIPVPPGKHSLVLRIDWCGSEQIDFEARPDEQIVFECGSSLTGWRMFWHSSTSFSRPGSTFGCGGPRDL